MVKHLVFFKACYGATAFKSKHHYALHLGPQLMRHGFLLMTLTHERKHRLVFRYTRDRRNLKSWTAGAIEDTCHQLWELSGSFFGVCKLANAKGVITISLMEMCPGTTVGDFTILNDLSGNGGSIDAGDVVSCFHDGRPQMGELMVAIGVQRATAVYESYAIIALWQPHPESAVDVVCGPCMRPREIML